MGNVARPDLWGARGQRPRLPCNFRRHLAIGYEPQAGHHRVLVNVKTTTASMQQLHLRSPFAASSAWGSDI
jgi:hypothetical protein